MTLARRKYFSSDNVAGQRFPSKTLELSLQATVRFPDHYTPTSGVDTDDPFCVGLNTYADVSLAFFSQCHNYVAPC